MTRFLSDSLQAPEPMFRLGLKKLEAANGNPNTDIRFTTEVRHRTRSKYLQLNLDPDDTSPRELYHALQQRVRADDQRLVRRLQTSAATHISAQGDVVAGMIHELKQLPDSKRCYSIKSSVMKSIFKANPPKKAMKKLGYRSMESLIKHESAISILAAAWIYEGTTWQHKLLDQYKKLNSSSMESRSIAMIELDSDKWQKLAHEITAQKKHNLISLKELGALVFLPLPKSVPSGSVTASMTLALHELNEIRACSTYLQLCQVRGDFGEVLRRVATEEPELRGTNLDQPVAWSIVQQYYVRISDKLKQDLLEPQIRLDDIAWHPIEHSLAQIEPSFEFWKDSNHLGLLHEGKPVSMNIVDSALNYCNQLRFEDRISSYFQHSLWHELMLRYLRHDTVEQTVMLQLQPEYAEVGASA